MLGLILKTLQVFVQDTYGPEKWEEISAMAGLQDSEIEAMLYYEKSHYYALLEAAERAFEKPAEVFLEDLGTYLVSHPNSEGLRRLLRYGGVDFIEFLHSLEDLPGRARLAVADLDLPELELADHAQSAFRLRVAQGLPGFGHMLVGVLRAMADDYGALVLLDYDGGYRAMGVIDITVIETAFSEGRDFDLSATMPRGETA
ncbi:MAG: heme NO-binding domain-containing protein [Pelagimonas sp.]|jgi:hypothetical protein|nr:heme NO-binding domain-containing protein [Pelagimonas sp.]